MKDGDYLNLLALLSRGLCDLSRDRTIVWCFKKYILLFYFLNILTSFIVFYSLYFKSKRKWLHIKEQHAQSYLLIKERRTVGTIPIRIVIKNYGEEKVIY